MQRRIPFNWVIYLPSLFKLEVDRCNSSYCSIDRYCRKPCWQRLRRVAKKIQDVMGIVTQVSNEIASGAKEIKSFGNEENEEIRFKS
ncbi:MAG: hypothetical protein CM15mP12_0950 [Gammaproteobacteria bacterium]|nr:MAG: hypothetical protein CM15mP12_0950 [Gammaproteobacteria bacterium]